MSIKSEYNFVHLSDDEIAQAITAEAKARAIAIIKKDLQEYLDKLGREASFKGWIAYICPENIKVDKRLDYPNSDWHQMWNNR